MPRIFITRQGIRWSVVFPCASSDVEQKDRKQFPKQRRDLKKRCNEYVALDIPIPSWKVFLVQIPSQEVFGCLGLGLDDNITQERRLQWIWKHLQSARWSKTNSECEAGAQHRKKDVPSHSPPSHVCCFKFTSLNLGILFRGNVSISECLSRFFSGFFSGPSHWIYPPKTPQDAW